MILEVNDRSYVVFDLDDTLYPEIDFVYSGIHHLSTVLEPIIGQSVADALLTRHGDKQEMFGWLVEKFHLPLEFGVERLLDEYRHHPPILSLPEGSRRLLDQLSALGIPMGLVTDGRIVSQRNKVKAHGDAKRL